MITLKKKEVFFPFKSFLRKGTCEECTKQNIYLKKRNKSVIQQLKIILKDYNSAIKTLISYYCDNKIIIVVIIILQNNIC